MCSADWHWVQGGLNEKIVSKEAVMKRFWSFAVKEFRHIFRDRRTTMIVLIMPVIQILLFGFAISTEIRDARIFICGDSSDASVRRISERIDNNAYLRVCGFIDSPADADMLFRKGEADAVVCLENRFDDRLNRDGIASVRILGDGSDPNSAQMISNYISGVLNTEQGRMNVGASASGASGASGASDASGASGAGGMQAPPVKFMYNPGMLSSYNFVPGVMGMILMLICSMMTAVSIVKEKENGTMELLLVSPVKPLWVIASKVIPYFVISVLNFITILLLSKYVMGVAVKGSLLLLSFVSMTFILCSLGIGILISVIASTQKTALLISGMGLTMPTMIFSGFIFPCESMPRILQWFSDIIPAKWYIIMTKKIMIEGVGFSYMTKEYAVLFLMTVVLLTSSTYLFRKRM